MTARTPHQEKQTWLALLVRAATLRDPTHIQIRQHKHWLMIRATFEPLPGEVSDEGEQEVRAEIVISQCRDFKFTLKSELSFADFKGEWPPYEAMRLLDKPQLVGLDGGRLNG